MMKNLKRTLAHGLLSGFLFASLLQAQAPQMINYQGKLVIDGTPLRATTEITFTIFDAANSGTPLWSEKQLVTPTTDGIFTVLLGKVNPFPKDLFTKTGKRFLAMNIGNNPPLPQRAQLTSVAYALNAAHADTAQVARDASRLDAPDGNPTNAVFVDKDGNVGVGTTIPAAKLEVAGKAIIQGSQFEIQGQDLQLGTKDVRQIGNKREQRALVHNFGDMLNVNYAGDFEGGTVIHGSGTTPNLFVSADSNGNVGIGTTNPKVKLDVAGTINTTYLNVAPKNHQEEGGEILLAGGNRPYPDWTMDVLDDRLRFFSQPANPPPFVINRNGNVGLGISFPGEKLHVVGNILATGKICGDLNCTSSKEFKENLAALSLSEATTTLENLDPVKFTYKADEQKDLHAGFIAEDVPELVATPDRKGVSPMDIVAVLTKVMQAQQKEIAALREEVNALKQRVK